MLRHRATDPLPARDRGHKERSIRDVCAATIVVRLQNIRAHYVSILYGQVSIHSRPEPICERIFAGNLRIDRVSISSGDDLVENLQNRFAIAFGCAADFYFHWSDFGSQKGPVRPIEAKIDTISSAVRVIILLRFDAWLPVREDERNQSREHRKVDGHVLREVPVLTRVTETTSSDIEPAHLCGDGRGDENRDQRS